MNQSLTNAASLMGIKSFRKILDGAENLDECDAKGRTSLFRVARLGKSEHVKLLIERGADVNITDSLGEAPLQAAARYGHIECLELLLKAGANLDYCPDPKLTKYSESALCSAARKAPEAAIFLLECGADPNAGTSARRYPLACSIYDGNGDIMVSRLLSAAANINAQNGAGETALHMAILAGSIPLVQKLLKHGADPEIEGDYEGTAIFAAIRTLGDPVALVLALLPSKPNLSVNCPITKMTPLELARFLELPEVVKILSEAGAVETEESEAESEGSLCVGLEDLVGTTQPFSIRIVSSGSSSVDPTEEDFVIARDICGKAPSFLDHYGWKSSPNHWEILRALSKNNTPSSIPRIAYFVRGYLNAPAGEEMNDGPALLGESYEKALARMVEEGLVQRANALEAVELSCSASSLKSVAKLNGIKVSGRKAELLIRLTEYLGVDQLEKQLKPIPHFSLRLEGRCQLEKREHCLSRFLARFRVELCDLLREGDFIKACHFGRMVESLSLADTYLRPEREPVLERYAKNIASARKTLEASLPGHLASLADDQLRLRIIAAAISLSGDRYMNDEWNTWDSSLKIVCTEELENISPGQFQQYLILGE